MVSRAAALMRLFASRRIDTCLENPGGSLMPKQHRMAETIRLLGLDSTKIYMGNYGGQSKKDMLLWSQAAWIKLLWKPYNPDLQGEAGLPLVEVSADGRVTGAAGLKDSQEYTLKFGQACTELLLHIMVSQLLVWMVPGRGQSSPSCQ